MTHVPFSVWMLSLSTCYFLTWNKLIQRLRLFLPCFPLLPYLAWSTFLSVLTWTARNMSDGSNSMAKTKAEKYHLHSLNLTFVRNSTLSLTYLSIHCGGWRVPFLQWEHWQMEQGYYTSSKSFNSGCNGLAGGGSKNSNAFLHSGRHHLPPSLLRIPGCNVVKKVGMLGF